MAEEKHKRDFKGIWIPSIIWLDRELTIMEKIFLVEIDSLDNDQGCFASNGYFSRFFNITPQRASQIINSLIKKEIIKAKYYKEGKETVKRVLNILDTYKEKFKRVSNKFDEGIKKSLRGYKENVKDNNTVSNTFNKPIIKKQDERISQIINHWNKFDLPKCEKSTPARVKIIEKVLKVYDLKIIKECIEYYDEAINDPVYFETYKWSIDNFFTRKRGYTAWMKDGEKWQAYINWFNSPEQKKRRGDE